MKRQSFKIVNDNRTIKLFGKLPLGTTSTNVFTKREDGSYHVDGVIGIRKRIPKYVSECKRQQIMDNSMISSSTLKNVLEEHSVRIYKRETVEIQIKVIRINDISQEFSVLVTLKNRNIDNDVIIAIVELIDEYWTAYITPYKNAWEKFLRRNKTTAFKYWTRKR